MHDSPVPSPSPAWIQSNFRALLDAAPDAMLVVDDHGSIVFANLQTEHLFGYSGSELLGRKVEALIPPRFRAKHPGHRAGYSRNPSVRPMGAMLDLYGSRKDGRSFLWRSASALFTRRMETWSSVPSGTSSERKLAEAQIRKLNNELERALRRSDRTRNHRAASSYPSA